MAHQQSNGILFPIHSGKVTPEAAARLPRQSSDQTREDMLEAGNRLMNAYILDRDEAPDVADSFDLLPAIELGDTLLQASEIARQRLVNEGRVLPHERVAPLTAGAFYKTFANDYETARRSSKPALGAFRQLVAERLIDKFEPGQPFADLIATAQPDGGFGMSLQAGTEAECEKRLYNPSYIFLGIIAAMGGRNSVLQPRALAAYGRDLAATAASLQYILRKDDRQLRTGLSINDFSSALTGLMRGSVVKARLESTPTDPECWRGAGLTAAALASSFTVPIIRT